MNGKLLEPRRSVDRFSSMKHQLDREYADSKKDVFTEILSEFKSELKGQILVKQRSISRESDREGSVRSLRSYHSKRSDAKALSRFARSKANSTLTHIPILSRERFEDLTMMIVDNKRKIVETAQKMKVGLREILSSSKFLKIFQKAGVRVQLGDIKGVLKQLNFNFNGASCSLTQLFEKLGN